MLEGAIVVLFLAFCVGGGLLLYPVVRTEHDEREVMSRADAERAARRDDSER